MLRVGTQSDYWYDNNDPDGSVAFIKSCGFDTIDFNLHNLIKINDMVKAGPPYTSFFDASAEELCEHFRGFKEACQRYDVTVAQVHGPFPTWLNGEDEMNEYIIGVYEKCFAISAFIGAPGIVVHPVHGAGDKEWEANTWQYRRLIPFAKKYGVKIVLENIFGRYNDRFIQGRMSNPEDAIKYFDTLTEEAGFDAFGFCFDVGHALITCQNIPRFIRMLGHRLTNLHIHDNNGLDDLHIVPYTCLTKGQNTVCDWSGFISALKEIGYKGDLCFETFRTYKVLPRELWADMYRFNAAIGHYFAKIILDDGEK